MPPTPAPADPIPRTIECRDPATLEKLGEVPVLGADDVRRMVQRARDVQPAWGAASFAERRAVLEEVLAQVLDRQEEICRLAVRDSGKTMVDAVMGEVFPVCEKLRYTIAHGEADLRSEPRSSGFLVHKAARVEYRPLGVIGVIAPWNFPFHNLFCPTIPALFAGNAVVAKVSEWASWSALEYVEILRAVLRRRGFSPDLVQIATGYGETGAALVGSGVDKIFFTGSPANGRKVMAEAAKTLTPVVLELGGKDPMIVCDDADLQRAADAAMLGVFTGSGQMCVAAERIYVQSGIWDRFLPLITERVRALRQGPPLGDLVDIGALTMPRQLEIVDELVRDAVARGARALAGGRPNADHRGSFYEPTLLVDVDHSMRVVKEECFGPVMLLIKFEDDDQAVRLANDTAYGLGSSVFTRDPARGERIAARIRAGMTVVNDYGIAYMVQSLPFGGLGISGFGKINGREGLRACCHEHAVVTDRIPVGRSIGFHPVRAHSYGLIESTVRVIYARGIKARASALMDLGRNLSGLMSESRRER